MIQYIQKGDLNLITKDLQIIILRIHMVIKTLSISNTRNNHLTKTNKIPTVQNKGKK